MGVIIIIAILVLIYFVIYIMIKNDAKKIPQELREEIEHLTELSKLEEFKDAEFIQERLEELKRKLKRCEELGEENWIYFKFILIDDKMAGG